MVSRRNIMTSVPSLLTCLVVATICILETLCSCTNRSEFVEKNIGLAKTQFWSSKAQDLDQCMQMCIRRKPCNSINYDFQTKVCQLNTGMKDNTPTTSGEMLGYSQFDWWPATFDEHCHSRPCADDEVCIPGILDVARASDTCSYTCMPAGRIVCPMPEAGLNGGRYVGDINEWTCGHGLAGSDTATCLPSGQWDKEINPTCEEIHGHQCTEDAFCSTINADCDGGNCACRPNMEYNSITRMCVCGSPPSPVNAVIVSNDDTTATYECNSGYNPKVSSGEPTRTCSMTTGWTPSTNYECYKCEDDPPPIDGAALSELSADSTRTYTCGPDPIKQRLDTGNGTIRCLETGTWETTTFACYGLKLTPSPAPGITNIPGTAVGYLEIYKDGWHNVCYDSWNWKGTMVACRSLGYIYGGSFHKEWYDLKDEHKNSVPDSTKSYKLDNLNCPVDGQGLELCDYNLADCNHDKDMVLTCFEYDFQAEPSVDLRPSKQLWVNLDGVSKPLCREGWSNSETEISCKTVNSAWRRDSHGDFEDSTLKPFAQSVKCDETEPHLFFCQNKGWGYGADCRDDKFVEVECDTS